MTTARTRRKQTEQPELQTAGPYAEVENRPASVEPADVEFRDATFSKTTRDRLATVARWMRAHQHRSEYRDAEAIEDVIARWDANEATAITAPDVLWTPGSEG